MARFVSFILLAVLLVAAAGCGGAKALGRDPHVTEMLLAAAGATAGSLGALVPLWMARGASQASVAQAALLATVLHMVIALAAAAAVVFTLNPDAAFLYWAAGFYWSTLVAVASAAVRSVRAAAAGTRACAASQLP